MNNHTPVNVNVQHAHEKQEAGINQRIAIMLTKAVGTMACAYAFALLAIIGFPGLAATPTQYVQWLSQTFIQLVMLSVIMVGQGVLGRKQELQAEQAYQTTVKTYSDTEQLLRHLEEQNNRLFAIEQILRKGGWS